VEIWINPACSKCRAATEPLRTVPRNAAHRPTWIEAMTAHPILIQRPITAADNTTAIARDPESLAKFLP
jgi:arsenate reductase